MAEMARYIFWKHGTCVYPSFDFFKCFWIKLQTINVCDSLTVPRQSDIHTLNHFVNLSIFSTFKISITIA